MARGYLILDYRYRCPYGEIDVIAKKRGCIHFIEVKYRSQIDHIDQALPSFRSRQRLFNASQYYMKARADRDQVDQDFSIIIVSKYLRLQWFKQALRDL